MRRPQESELPTRGARPRGVLRGTPTRQQWGWMHRAWRALPSSLRAQQRSTLMQRPRRGAGCGLLPQTPLAALVRQPQRSSPRWHQEHQSGSRLRPCERRTFTRPPPPPRARPRSPPPRGAHATAAAAAVAAAASWPSPPRRAPPPRRLAPLRAADGAAAPRETHITSSARGPGGRILEGSASSRPARRPSPTRQTTARRGAIAGRRGATLPLLLLLLLRSPRSSPAATRCGEAARLRPHLRQSRTSSLRRFRVRDCHPTQRRPSLRTLSTSG